MENPTKFRTNIPGAARRSRLPRGMTAQGRQALIEETRDHVIAALKGDPMAAAKALARFGILAEDSQEREDHVDEDNQEVE